MLTESLFICYSTPNYAPVTEIFLDSLKAIGVSKINHKLDVDAVPSAEGDAVFGSHFWHYCVRSKIQHLLDVISTDKSGVKYFIFCDCDLRFIRQNAAEWGSLQKYIDEDLSEKDVVFMRENVSDIVNTGFFIIKNNQNISRVISFFADALEIIKKSRRADIPFGDQSVVNRKKDDLRYGYVPLEYIVFGSKIFDRNKCLIHHAIGARNVNEKKMAMLGMKIKLQE